MRKRHSLLMKRKNTWSKGKKKTLETIQRMKTAQSNKSFEWRKKISEGRKGIPSPRKGTKLSLEVCLKISKGLTGRKRSLESRMKQSKSRKGIITWMKGKKHKPESLLKISNSLKGKKVWNSNKNMPQISGDKHWNWKGGITPENLKLRFCLKYQIWRRAVFKRDKYTCQDCGDNKGGNLISHHIKPWSEFPKERFKVDNGIVLCEKCHKKKHKRLNQ